MKYQKVSLFEKHSDTPELQLYKISANVAYNSEAGWNKFQNPDLIRELIIYLWRDSMFAHINNSQICM